MSIAQNCLEGATNSQQQKGQGKSPEEDIAGPSPKFEKKQSDHAISKDNCAAKKICAHALNPFPKLIRKATRKSQPWL